MNSSISQSFMSALNGTSSLSPDPATQKPGMAPLFDMILKKIPGTEMRSNGPFQWQPALLDYNDFVGRIGIGTVRSVGQVHVGDTLTDVRKDGSTTNFKVMKLYTFYGMSAMRSNQVEAGDICGMAGLTDIGVGDTVCDPKKS
jgi:GTP-binding protein